MFRRLVYNAAHRITRSSTTPRWLDRRMKGDVMKTICCLAILLASLWATSAHAKDGRARILVGDNDMLIFNAPSRHTPLAVERAKDKAIATGYQTLVYDPATIGDFKAVVASQPDLLVIFAHGVDGGGVVSTDSGFVDQANFGGATFPEVNEVVLMACGQLSGAALEMWRKLFPNAKIVGYSGTTYPWRIRMDLKRRIKFHPPGTPTAPAPPVPLPPLDPRFQPEPRLPFPQITWATADNPLFQMPTWLAAKVGTQVMNLYEVGPEAERDFLFGVRIADGVITAYEDSTLYPSPSYEVTMTADAVYRAHATPDSLLLLGGDEGITINRLATSVPEPLLYRATVAVNFGASMEIVPAASPMGWIVLMLLVATSGAAAVTLSRRPVAHHLHC